MRNRGFINLLVLVLVNLMWAAQYPAYKVASDHMDAVTLNFWTFAFAIVLLLPFLLRERRVQVNRHRLGKKAWGEFLMLGLIGVIPPSVFMSWGIKHSTASNAAMISLTIPVLMVLMAFILLGEKMTWLRWLSISMAILGTLLISRIKLEGQFFASGLLLGNTVIFVAGFGSAFYNTYSKKLLERFTELEVLIYGYVVGCVSCVLLSRGMVEKPLYRIAGYPPSAWIGIFVLGAFSWGLAMVLWMWVLKQLQVSQVSVSIYLLPLFGVLLSAITLHERLSSQQLIGGVLVFIATYLTADYESRKAQALVKA